MSAHLADQHLGRELEEFLVEVTSHGEGFLDQPGDRFQQIGVGPRHPRGLACPPGDLVGDPLAALGPVGQHVRLPQRGEVVLGSGEREFLRRGEAVAARLRGAGDVGELHRERFSVQDGADPVHGAREGIRVQRIPAHRLLEGDAADDPLEKRG